MNISSNGFHACPQSWELVKLGDLAESVKGKNPRNKAKGKSLTYSLPYIDIQALETGEIKSWTDGKDCCICNESDLLMVWDGSRSGLVSKGKNGALGSTLVRIDIPLIEKKYVFYFLQSKYQLINSQTKGTGTPHVNPDVIWNFKIPIPPLNEQHRIVAKIEALIDEIGRGVESLLTAKSAIDLYRKSLLKAAFEGRLTEDWRTRNSDKLESSEILLARIQEEREKHYKNVLIEWEKSLVEWRSTARQIKKPRKPKRLQKFLAKSKDSGAQGWAIVQLGLVIDEPIYGTSKKCGQIGNKGVLRIPNIDSRRIDLEDMKSADFDALEIVRYSLIEGDILTVRSNGSLSIVGNSAIVEHEHVDYLFAGYLIRLRPIATMLVSKYLLYLMMEPNVRTQIEQSAKSTSGVNNISAKELQALNVSICSLAEQIEIARILDNHFKAADLLDMKIDKALASANLLQQSILKKAFTGQLVPQDSSDEPASILLERVKAEHRPKRKNKRKRKISA